MKDAPAAVIVGQSQEFEAHTCLDGINSLRASFVNFGMTATENYVNQLCFCVN